MKCPKCGSLDTKKVSVIDHDWHIGHERCKNELCKYQGDWLEFCDTSLTIDKNPHTIVFLDIEVAGDTDD